MRKRGGANEVIQQFHKNRKWGAVLRLERLWKAYLVGSNIASVTPGEISFAQGRARAFYGKRERRVL